MLQCDGQSRGAARMDLDKTLAFIEKYARGYIGYLLAFFGEPSKDPTADPIADDPLNTVLIFSLLSAFLGSNFDYFATQGKFPPGDFLIARVSVEFAYWVAMSVLLLGVLRVLRVKCTAMSLLLIVLSVAPVAYALGGYMGYLMRFISRAWASDAESPYWAYATIVGVQLVTFGTYTPLYVGRIAGIGRTRTAVTS